MNTKSSVRLWTVAALLLGACIPEATAPTPANAPAGPSGASDASAALQAAMSAPPLRAAAEQAGKKVGTALAAHQLDVTEYAKVVPRHFDSLTPENEMKWDTIEPQEGGFGFAKGDALVAFAAQNQMRVRGHVLVYHKQIASWVKSLTGDALRKAMLSHIRGVAGHYKGKVAQWDVINEALTNEGELTPESMFTALGPSYFDDAFKAAHEADPQALLFYNDYDIEGVGSPKVEAVYKLVKRLKDAHVPIDGIGLQMHVDPRKWPSAAQIRQNMEKLASLGVVVEITEMDVPVGEIPGTLAQKLEAQRVLTHDIVAACMAVKACTGVTVWGASDRGSWLNSPEWAKLRGAMPHLPLPFDGEFRPKPMFTGIADAFAGK